MKPSQLMSGILLGVTMMSAGLLFAQAPVFPFLESSLNGVVTSKSDAPLEGIIVRAVKEKTPIAYNVVSDAQGKYRFPKLDVGRYTVEIARADGMEEPSNSGVEIKSGQEAHVNFRIGPAQYMDEHMTSVDWLRNLPGTPEQIELISDSCIHCHTGNLTRFRFDKANWLKVIRLMRSTVLHSQDWGNPVREGRASDPKLAKNNPKFEETNQVIADFLAKVRGPEPLKYDPATTKIIPRPTGRATRVMFTEYWIPYENAELHDIGVAPDGMVWWTDWRWPYLGRLNPNTGEMKYWESPPLEGKPEVHPGSQEVGFDKEGNVWTTITWTGGLLKFDPKTEKFITWTFPDQGYRKLMQNGMDHERGRVWFSTHNMNNGTDNDIGFYVPETGSYTVFDDFALYGLVVDEQGNANALERGKGRSQIGRVDAATGKRTNYPTPTKNAFPRRGDHDSQGRIWFAEYNAGQVGVLDPKAGKITEYKLPLGPLSHPYGTGVDRVNDMVWVENYRADVVTAVNSKTGEVWDYLLPERHVMARSPVGHPSAKPGYSVMWLGTLGKATNGKLVKIEAWYE